MRIRCPSCGATMSLEVLIAHDAAREVLIELSGISDELLRSCLKYLTLFRPATRDLSFDRVARLVGELRPQIMAETVVRSGQSYPAPRAAWVWAFNRCVAQRDAGRLKLPLTSHGYLYEMLTGWRPEPTEVYTGLPEQQTTQPAGSRLRQGVAALSGWANAQGATE